MEKADALALRRPVARWTNGRASMTLVLVVLGGHAFYQVLVTEHAHEGWQGNGLRARKYPAPA